MKYTVILILFGWGTFIPALSFLEGDIVTGFRTLEPDSEDWSQLTNFVEPLFQSSVSFSSKSAVERVHEARRKVEGNGTTTMLAFSVLPTNCSNSDTRSKCVINGGDFAPQFCSTKIFQDSTTSSLHLLSLECGQVIKLSSPDEDIEEKFQAFMKTYDIHYATDAEYNCRLQIFRRKLHLVQDMNEKAQGHTVFGVTVFSDKATKDYNPCFGIIGHH